jgi:predicted dienelactone hydrolase
MTYKVGLRTIPYTDAARRNWPGTGPRPLLADIWYPAAADADEALVFIGPPDYALFVAGRAARDVDLADGADRFPLVLLSHGTGGATLQLGWLAGALAARGYVVAGVNHHGNTAVERYTADGFARVWERPKDLSALAARLLADPAFGPRIDPGRIGAAGFSLGGYTALALAGGVLDLRRLLALYAASGRDLAADMPPEFSDPKALVALLTKLVDADDGHRHSYRDPRVRAAFLIAPALGEAFTAEGLAPVDIPVEIVVGAADALATPETNALWLARHVARAEATVLEGLIGHYVFVSECTEMGCQALPAICQDAPSVDRRAVHERVSAMALRFFDRHLGRT